VGVDPGMSADSSAAAENLAGGYIFIPSLGFCSAGVVALPGMTIDRVSFARALPLPAGYEAVRGHLRRSSRPMAALCAMELRSPASTGLEEFLAFNEGYLAQLGSWGLLIDGDSPLARTNVVPAAAGPSAPSVVAFSYTREANEGGQAYVMSGVAELPTGSSYPQDIVHRGDTTSPALIAKAQQVVRELSATVRSLGATWDNSTSVHLYTSHPIALGVQREALNTVGIVPTHGLTWHDAQPPVRELELEIDLRRYGAQYTIGDARPADTSPERGLYA